MILNPGTEEAMSITVTLLGKVVTPEEAAVALNVDGGPYVLVSTERGEDGPEAHVYPARTNFKGRLWAPWVSCPVFTADTVERVREGAHVLSAAADLILLAGTLAAETEARSPVEP
jgi:hypothetical protein